MKVRLRSMVIPLSIAIVTVVVVVMQQPSSPQKPLDVAADTQSYADLTQLVRASDAVVVARATQSRPGRVVGSDMDPTAAIRTQFVTLQIGDVLHGKADATVVLEQEVTLANGRPIVVNGVPPTSVGDEGVFFLVSDPSRQVPYMALTNHQSRYLVTGSTRDQLVSSSSDSLGLTLAGLGPFELRCQILTAGDTGRHC